jgi:hypothetical protein
MRQYRSLMVSHPVTGKRISVNEHVYIWLLANGLWKKGKIRPSEGYVIHHKDFNHLNNDIANLECITYSHHNQLHWDRDDDRRKRQGIASRKTWASRSKESRDAQMAKARAASTEKLKREGMTPAQKVAWQKMHAAAYGGTRLCAKQFSVDEVAEIKRLYSEVKGKHGKVLALAERFGVSNRRICRVALT